MNYTHILGFVNRKKIDGPHIFMQKGIKLPKAWAKNGMKLASTLRRSAGGRRPHRRRPLAHGKESTFSAEEEAGYENEDHDDGVHAPRRATAKCHCFEQMATVL
jgi:hypothetical protein